jgi:hypothetical protein
MGKQVTHCHAVRLLACCASDDEAGKKLSDGEIEIKKPALEEQHCSGSSGHDLGEARNVEDGLCSNGGGFLIVGETAKRILKDYPTIGENSEGTTGKGPRGDRLVKDVVGGCKSGALIGRRCHEGVRFLFHGFQAS